MNWSHDSLSLSASSSSSSRSEITNAVTMPAAYQQAFEGAPEVQKASEMPESQHDQIDSQCSRPHETEINAEETAGSPSHM
jgi:hypothetical protein